MMSTFTTSILLCAGCSSQGNQTSKRDKVYPGLREVKLFLFADDIILYIENPKESPKMILKLIMSSAKL